MTFSHRVLVYIAAAFGTLACSEGAEDIVEDILRGRIEYSQKIGSTEYTLSKKLVPLEIDGKPEPGIQTSLQARTENPNNSSEIFTELYKDFESNGEVDTATSSLSVIIGGEPQTFTSPFLVI